MHIFAFLLCKDALPVAPVQSEQEISDNDIDIDSNDFSKELPFEAEYYRTSTDCDEFVRPNANPSENEIDEEDGIDINEPNTFVYISNCTYNIAIKLFFERIDDLEIDWEGLKIASGTKYNLSLSDFLEQTKVKILDTIKGNRLTNELVNDVMSYIRQTFLSAFGHEDNCGVSTIVISYFTKNDTQVDSPETSEETTNVPTIEESTQSGTEALNTETTITNDEEATEEYQSKTLTRPKLSEIIQDAIDVYKALNHWKYSQQF